MATTFSEGQHKAGWLISELRRYGSRTLETLASGQNLITGTVVGRLTSGLTGTSAVKATGANTGNGTMGALTITAPAKPGIYRLRVTAAAANAGTFEVEDPDGVPVGFGTVAVAFSAAGIAFTLADGATDFVVGDGFDFTIIGASKIVVCDPTATNGAQVAIGFILDSIDATSADHAGTVVIERMAEVRDVTASSAAPALAQGFQGVITWGAGFTTAAQKTVATAQLLALGISIRS